jgi:hypothetical protein
VRRRQAALKAATTSARRFCQLGGSPVSAELAPTSASQVVSSPVAQRLTPVRFVAVKKELDLIAFVFSFKVLSVICTGQFVISQFFQALSVKCTSPLII